VGGILDIEREFSTEEACFEHLERLRWPAGVECPKCLGKKISRINTRGKTGKRRRLYQCLLCRNQFTVRTGTIFQDSHLPLTTWFKAIALVADTKNKASVNMLKRRLKIRYRTASYLLIRIRQAMATGGRLELRG
jgi:transposase-like protein